VHPQKKLRRLTPFFVKAGGDDLPSVQEAPSESGAPKRSYFSGFSRTKKHEAADPKVKLLVREEHEDDDDETVTSNVSRSDNAKYMALFGKM